ncbi:hypothetical protein GA0074696_3830 [Micromonospora purpureochromogenes]|uniref:Uncharacterized protein n=1 Tax=Micromonospora purpureochromogenes TaxID=47872 RepID=A0A1C4YY47_9ACTN|nr:hypothetical protein [Micromonospora purpureochromogenes]SCF25618.1 hypothetical protein GA0074696_3830 [Micromonospora purpureochromogenes]
MGDRDILDALNTIEAASKGIDQALRAAQDHSGKLNPMLLDIELVEQHRYYFGMGLDYLEESYGGRRAADDPTDEEYDGLRRRRFGQLPERFPPAKSVELAETDPGRETYEPD